MPIAVSYTHLDVYKRQDESNEALENLKKTAQDAAIANGLFENARSNAETILTGFFGNVYDLDKYCLLYTSICRLL